MSDNYWRDARREMRRKLTPELLQSALSLAMGEEELPSLEKLATLSRDQMVVAWEWAVREHFHAGDLPTQRRPRPVYL